MTRSRRHGVRRRHRRRGPRRPRLRDPPQAAQARTVGLRAGEGLRGRRAHDLRLRAGTRAARCAAAGMARRAARHLRARAARRVLVPDPQVRDPAAQSAADAQPRQFHRLARAARAVDGTARRGAGRRHFPGLCGSGSARFRRRPGRGRAHRRHGTRPRRQARTQLRAGRRHPRRHDHPGRGLPRQRDQAAHCAARPRRRAHAADLRTRLQGTVAAAARPRRARPDPAHDRLAGGLAHLRRQLRLPHRPRSRVRRLCRRPRLRGPALQALRGVPAVQAPSAHACAARGRRTAVLRRAHDRGGRLAVAAAHGSAGTHADRRHRRAR